MGFEWLSDPQAWVALATLAALEIVLGIDNIIFISILVGRLPEHQRAKGRIIGLSLAMATRLMLLVSIAWIMRLTAPFFEILGHPVSGRDLILLGGGLFLLWKAVHEIHQSLEVDHEADTKVPVVASFGAIMVQIAIIDIVFSLDSVITAVGMTDRIGVMVAAVVGAVLIMMVFAGPVSAFVERHPTVKMLALSFLLLIGFTLVAEGLHLHIPKGYIYFAMAFSLGVEALNLRLRKRARQPIVLQGRFTEPPGDSSGA